MRHQLNHIRRRDVFPGVGVAELRFHQPPALRLNHRQDVVDRALTLAHEANRFAVDFEHGRGFGGGLFRIDDHIDIACECL